MYRTSENEIVIGIDIGGTNIAVAAVSPEGEILSRTGGLTLPQKGPELGTKRIIKLIRKVQQNVEGLKTIGIGIGCTGPIDRIKGVIHNPYTLPSWEGYHLADHIEKEFGVPVVMENDAHVGALGENWIGAGKDIQHLVYITAGTGIGGGLILNGKLYTGSTGLAGEIGHQCINFNGPPCYCGFRGCVESIAASPAITKRAKQRLQTEQSIITELVDGDLEKITPRIISNAARKGDPLAKDLIHEAAFALGVGIGNLLMVLAPEMVILGGGMMRSFDLFQPTIQQVLNGLSYPVNGVRVVPAKLGLNAGVIGAARAILERHFLIN